MQHPRAGWFFADKQETGLHTMAISKRFAFLPSPLSLLTTPTHRGSSQAVFSTPLPSFLPKNLPDALATFHLFGCDRLRGILLFFSFPGV